MIPNPASFPDRDGPEFRSVPQCRVCRSPHRAEIEKAIAQGTRDIEIVRALPDGAHINARNVAEHRRRGHPPVDHRAVEEAAQAAQEGLRDVLALWTARETESIVLARTVVRKVMAQMAEGALQLTAQDGIRCAQLILKSEISRVHFERGVATRAVQALLRYVRDIMDDDQYAMFKKRVYGDPRMVGLGELDRLKMPKSKPGSTWAI